jgi:hypothetical protein
MGRMVLALTAACLLAGGGWVAGQQAAQFKVPVDPYVLSGADIGFRVEATTPGGVIGTWMVRLRSGEWVAAHSAPTRGRVIPLDSQ